VPADNGDSPANIGFRFILTATLPPIVPDQNGKKGGAIPKLIFSKPSSHASIQNKSQMFQIMCEA
jgi:hypothetical protein